MTGEDDGTIPFKRLGAKMTTIERESAIIEHMKLETEIGVLRLQNTKLRAEKEELIARLFDCLQALCMSVRSQQSWKPRSSSSSCG